MPRPHKIVGHTLIGAFAVIVVLGAAQAKWANWVNVASLLSTSAIFAGFLLLPGIMVLKREWEQLAAVISGG